MKMARANGLEPRLLEAVDAVNDRQDISHDCGDNRQN